MSNESVVAAPKRTSTMVYPDQKIHELIREVVCLKAALSNLVEAAESTAWSANIGTMDEAITQARKLID